MTTTCDGCRIGRSDSTAERQSRRSASSSMRWAVVRSSWTWTTPSSNHSRVTSPTVRNTRRIGVFPGIVEATSRRNPAERAIIARSSSSTVADAFVLVEVGDGERHLGFLAAGHSVVLADADQVVAGLGDEGDVCPRRLAPSRPPAPRLG